MNLPLFRFRTWRIKRALARMDLPEPIRAHVAAAGRVDWDQPADRARFVVFDAEMTGLGPEDRLLALGAVRIEGSRIILGDGFHEIMDPDQTISPASIKVHHILPAMAAGRPLAREVLPRFLQYIGADVLVAHNARYDRDFINREMRRHFGPPLLSPLVDVWALSRANSDLRRKYRVSGATDNHTLDALAAGLGLTFEDRHSAFGDALATALVFIKLMKGLQRFGIYRVRHLMKAGGLG